MLSHSLAHVSLLRAPRRRQDDGHYPVLWGRDQQLRQVQGLAWDPIPSGRQRCFPHVPGSLFSLQRGPSSLDLFLVHCPATVPQRTAWTIPWRALWMGHLNPQGSFPQPPADKGRVGPLDVKHIAGHILHQDAQKRSKANRRSSRTPPPSVNIWGPHWLQRQRREGRE